MRTLKELSPQAMSLPLRERANLAHALIQSLDDQLDTSVEKAWDSEVQKRIRNFESGNTGEFPAFDALDDIRSKFQK